MICVLCKQETVPWSYRICVRCADRVRKLLDDEIETIRTLYKERLKGGRLYREIYRHPEITEEMRLEYSRFLVRQHWQRFESAFSSVKLAMRGGSTVRGQGDYLDGCNCGL